MEKRKFALFAIIVLVCFFILPSVFAAGVIIQPGAEANDSYFREDDSNHNFGAAANLDIGQFWLDAAHRAILQFDLSSIPANQQIDSAILHLYMYNDGPGADVNLTAHRITHAWVEGSTGYDHAVDWDTYNGSEAWTTAGGDFDAQVEAHNITSTQNQWYVWDITNLVGSWYNGTYTNLGVLLKGVDEVSDIQMRKRFRSSDYGTASERPKLIVNYSALDSVNPNVSIISPLDQNYTTTTVLVNLSAADDISLDSIWFYNGSANVSYSSETSYDFPQGSTTLIAYANDSSGNINASESVSFFIDSLSPTLSIDHPEAKTYSINVSLPLNYSVSDSGIGLNSCWYNIDDGANTTIASCANTTFDVVGDGSHTVNLFANDSLGNSASDSVTFTVTTAAPAVNLLYPGNDSYLNYGENIYFNYTVDSGIDISACQFYGDFSGTWQLNQTNVSTVKTITNFFNLSALADGNYIWGIICNDSQNRASDINYTFAVDTILPSVSLSEPSGSKSSRDSLPLQFNVNDTNAVTCLYNVYRGTNIELANTSIGCHTNSTTFDVTVDADFTLNFYATDSAGNLGSASSGFSVSTGGGNPGGGGGGGGGGGSTTIIQTSNTTASLSVGGVSDMVISPGDEKTISLTAKNTGTAFLNDCKLEAVGSNLDWLSVGETKNLAAGEESDFTFSLVVPESADAGKYDFGLVVRCQETSEGTGFRAEIIEKQIHFKILDVERQGEDQILVSYSIEELSGIDQNIDLQFLLYDAAEEKVGEVSDTKQLIAGGSGEFETYIPVSAGLRGDYNLLININSETYSTFVQESIVLGAATGLAIFGEGINRDALISGAIILAFAIFAIVIFRRIWKHKKYHFAKIGIFKRKRTRKYRK